MTTALIADDEPHLASALQAQLALLWPALEVVAIARNGLQAAEQIQALKPDIAFLDIQMPGLTGLEVAQGIEGDTRAVFVTADDEHAVQAFEAQAIDYLLKPLKTERLQRTLDRLRLPPCTPDSALLAALQRLLAPSAGTIERLRWVRASSGELTHQVAVDEVLFFRADDKSTCVQTAGAEYLIRTPIAELGAQLDPTQFVQVHRSTIVNLTHLAGTRRDEASRLFLRLRGHAAELPVSRAYVHLFKAM
jgi:DNA-binding LytR/AlgR family response regulator